ncbi:hypothetical protein ACJX0J_024183, partial [Zea mays]
MIRFLMHYVMIALSHYLSDVSIVLFEGTGIAINNFLVFFLFVVMKSSIKIPGHHLFLFS